MYTFNVHFLVYIVIIYKIYKQVYKQISYLSFRIITDINQTKLKLYCTLEYMLRFTLEYTLRCTRSDVHTPRYTYSVHLWCTLPGVYFLVRTSRCTLSSFLVGEYWFLCFICKIVFLKMCNSKIES